MQNPELLDRARQAPKILLLATFPSKAGVLRLLDAMRELVAQRAFEHRKAALVPRGEQPARLKSPAGEDQRRNGARWEERGGYPRGWECQKAEGDRKLDIYNRKPMIY